jgi:hypothetical protein
MAWIRTYRAGCKNIGSRQLAVIGTVVYRPGGSSRNPFADPTVGEGVKVVEVSPMTIKYKTWLADSLLAASVLIFVVYFILLEFSKARLP